MNANVVAQSEALDSLENKLLKHTTNDTARVNLLNDLIYICYDTDINRAQSLIQEADELSRKLNYKVGKAEVSYYKGQVEIIKSNYTESIIHFQKARQLYLELNDQKGVSYSLNGLGIVYHSQGNYSKALYYYKKSANLDKKRKDLKGVSGGYLNIGNIYADQGNYSKALNFYAKAKRLKQKLGETRGVARTKTNIGSIYGEQNNYPKALECFNKAYALYEEIGDSLSTTSLLMNIGIIYEMQGKYEKALEYLRKAIIRCKSQKNQNSLAFCLNVVGGIKKEQGKSKEALRTYFEALSINESIQSKKGIAVSLNNIAVLQFDQKEYDKAIKNGHGARDKNSEMDNQLGVCRSNLIIAKVHFARNNTAEALQYALRTEKIAVELQLILLQKEVSELLSKIYSKTGDHKEAFTSYQRFKVLNDSLFNKENIEKITQLEYEYKYRKELADANSREMVLSKTVKSTSQDLEKSQRNSFLAIITILLISLVSAGIIFFLKLRNERAKTQNIAVEQKLLRSQMTPHFIFNSLAVLQGMILNKESKSTVSYLSKFSKLLRTTLDNSRQKSVPLSDEIDAVENYISLQNLDVNPPYKFSLSISQDVKNFNFLIPPMLIQPFIENAIIHAFVNQKENKEIDVKLTFSEDKLICVISDNGIGIHSTSSENRGKKSSLATAITEERLILLAKDFKMKGSLNIEDRKGFDLQGTVVTLVVPYRKEPIKNNEVD